MKKTTHIFPIIALSTLLAACGSSGKGNSNAKSTSAIAKAENAILITKPKEPAKQTHHVVKPAVVATPTEQPKPTIVAKPAEEVKAEQPKVEEPKVEEPKVEEPKVEELKVEEPKVEEPKVEEPKVEEPKVEEPKVEEPKVEEPKAEEPKAELQPELEQEHWSNAGNFPHNKDEIPVIYLVENDNAKVDIDKNFKERKEGIVTLKVGVNRDPQNHYNFRAFDENMYYGYFRDSKDMNHIENHYVYSFNEKAENKANLDGLTATYQGKFIYSTKSIPELAVPSNVELRYKNGKAEGEITSHFYGDTLFEVKSTDNVRTLELQPKREVLDNSVDALNTNPNSPDRAIINVHFINGKDGTENKSLVGKGGNEKYWGVLGAEKQ